MRPLPLYDARGNRYFVATPQFISQEFGISFESARSAAESIGCWAQKIIDAPNLSILPQSDGLIIGPFNRASPFELLIVNTDGSLAERSGNGLTIFSQFLVEQKIVGPDKRFATRVCCTDANRVTNSYETSIQPENRQDDLGFWIHMGTPQFGGSAVGLLDDGEVHSRVNNKTLVVKELEKIDPRWNRSVFVNVGNPHCVTILADISELPSPSHLKNESLSGCLSKITLATSDAHQNSVFTRGINLQWATVVSPKRILGRVFERGEGYTASSGTSATAIACAAWNAGLTPETDISVEMPGGVAPISLSLSDDGSEISGASLLGKAKLV